MLFTTLDVVLGSSQLVHRFSTESVTIKLMKDIYINWYNVAVWLSVLFISWILLVLPLVTDGYDQALSFIQIILVVVSLLMCLVAAIAISLSGQAIAHFYNEHRVAQTSVRIRSTICHLGSWSCMDDYQRWSSRVTRPGRGCGIVKRRASIPNASAVTFTNLLSFCRLQLRV